MLAEFFKLLQATQALSAVQFMTYLFGTDLQTGLHNLSSQLLDLLLLCLLLRFLLAILGDLVYLLLLILDNLLLYFLDVLS